MKNVVVNEQDEPAPALAVVNQHVVHEEINLSQPPSSQDIDLDLFLV